LDLNEIRNACINKGIIMKLGMYIVPLSAFLTGEPPRLFNMLLK